MADKYATGFEEDKFEDVRLSHRASIPKKMQPPAAAPFEIRLSSGGNGTPKNEKDYGTGKIGEMPSDGAA